MHQFHFGLETLLRIRRRQLDQAQEDFVRQQQVVIRWEAEGERLQAEQERSESEARAREQGEVDVPCARSYREYGHTLASRRAYAAQQLTTAQKTLETRRQEWVEAQRTVKSLEALRERRYEEYIQAARREEQIVLDETALAFRRVMPKI